MSRWRFFTMVVLSLLLGASIWADQGIAAATQQPNQDFTLRLGGLVFDPLAGEPLLPQGWDRSSELAPDLHLVQFHEKIQPDSLDALRAAGLEPVQYLHPNSYIVWGRSVQRDRLRVDPKVRWAGDFAPAYRVAARWRNLSEVSVQARVLLYRGAELEGLRDRLALAGGRLGTPRGVTEELTVADLEIPGSRLGLAASIPGVYSIQLTSDNAGSRAEVGSQISAGNIDGANIAFPGYLNWLATLGVDGSGVVVASVDEGVDENHPDLAQRMLPCVGTSCSVRKSEHGTNTAGIIVGDGASAIVDGSGFVRGLGVAPGARLIEQEWRPTFQQAGGMLELMTQSTRNGAVVSNNSWGVSSTAQGYDLDTLLVDAGVRDADPDLPGSQALIYVQAIDNGAGGISSQGSPDEGKNIFSVGSTIVLSAPEVQSPNIDNISNNSGHGPALDGRTIPHMVAPGCSLDTTKTETTAGFGYAGRCGTSMAAAHLSGAAALFVEYYRGIDANGSTPSPALVKAAFLPVAHDLENALDADGAALGHRPDSKQGWGRMNLSAVLAPADPVLYFDQPEVFEFSGQEWSRVVTAVNSLEPMRVMLVWTDAPGHGLGGITPAWNNNLDLAIEVGGDTYLGNQFGVDGLSVVGGSPDLANNMEGVFLANVTGNATLRVLAADINSNGVPHYGDKTDQDFALVCYNCALAPDFALSTDSAVLEICAPQAAAIDVDVEQIAGFPNPVTLSASGLPAGSSAMFDSNPVTPGSHSAFNLNPGTAIDGDYTVEIQGAALATIRSISFPVSLRTAVPAPPGLLLPADTSVDIASKPQLSWDPVPWVSRYLVEISTDPSFQSLVYSAVEAGVNHTLRSSLNRLTTYYWRVRATNACGYGAVSFTSSFVTANPTRLLLVDDDFDVPNEQNEYTAVLDGLGVAYDIWDVWGVHNLTEPDLETISAYEQVIWFSGKEEVYPGPDDTSEDLVLPAWLDQGGCLLISSIDYVLQQQGVTPFMQERLGVSSVTEDTGMNTVTGAGTVFGAIGAVGLGNRNPDFRDSVVPDVTAELAFAGNLGDAGVTKDGGWFRTSFLGFEIESAGGPEKTAILDAFLTWCAGLDAVDGDGDGVANDADCAPGDAGSWSAPSPITDLRLDKGAIGFSWTPPVSGSGARYDVLRSDDTMDFYNATCVVPDTIATSGQPDAAIPAPGELFYYLVGARNDCGLSTLGNHLDGSPRQGTSCEAERIWW